MLALVVEFRIKPEHIADFAAAIEDNARTSRETGAGCRQFDVCRDPADASLFFLHQLCDDEAAIQDHLESSHVQLMERRMAGWVQSKRVRTPRRAAP